MKKLYLLVLLILCMQAAIPAQEKSLAPGINDNFQDPDVDAYIKRFEGESRTVYAHRHDIVAALDLKPGMAVGDVGAGTGFFSLLLSDAVGPDGRVYAVDIAENFIEHIKTISEEHKKTNIEAIVCDERSVKLPDESIDLAFVCDTYHHFEYPFDSLASIYSALKPGGRLAIVDYIRVEGQSSDWTLNHVRCGMGGVIDEAQQAGFDFEQEHHLGMDDQYLITFVKPHEKPSDPEE